MWNVGLGSWSGTVGRFLNFNHTMKRTTYFVVDMQENMWRKEGMNYETPDKLAQVSPLDGNY